MSKTLNALNAIVPGWTESRPGAMLTNPNPGGGIIDCAYEINEWFVIFNDDLRCLEGFDTRDDAIEAFAQARLLTSNRTST